jgi:hypothetical protein
MIGIIIVAIVFSNLAHKYNKNRWGYGLLGVVTYFGATFVYGFIYAIIYLMNDPYATEDDIEGGWTLRLSAIGVGVVVSYILYYFLERNWKKEQKRERIDINEIGNS